MNWFRYRRWRVLVLILTLGVGVVGVEAQGGPFSAQIQRALRSLGFNTGTGQFSPTTPVLFADGTSGAPAMAFASESTLGIWRNTAGQITVQGVLNTTSTIVASSTITSNNAYRIGATILMQGPSNGNLSIANTGNTTGSQLKVDALPTVASGFGGSPSITAGSTPFAGSVNVGSGASSSGVINFNGTAFPSAPFCVASDDSTVLAVRPIATTTQLTLAAVAYTANDIVSWICVSSK